MLLALYVRSILQSLNSCWAWLLEKRGKLQAMHVRIWDYHSASTEDLEVRPKRSPKPQSLHREQNLSQCFNPKPQICRQHLPSLKPTLPAPAAPERLHVDEVHGSPSPESTRLMHDSQAGSPEHYVEVPNSITKKAIFSWDFSIAATGSGLHNDLTRHIGHGSIASLLPNLQN